MPTTRDRRYEDMTNKELADLAQQRGIEGRSRMGKGELAEALRMEDEGPDALELLVTQHDSIRGRFEEFQGLSPRPSKRKDELVQLLVTELVKHAEVEELVFYPAVRAEVPDVAGEIDEDLEEHHAAELLLSELDGTSSDARRFDAKVEVLRENVLHHMREEEDDLFPKVREALEEQRLRELGAAMVRAHQIAPSRPHPRAPDQPPANLVAGIPAALLDSVVGVARAAKRTLSRR